MKVTHPHTKNTVIMMDGLNLIAEIDTGRSGPGVDPNPDRLTVTIGEVGYAHCLMIYRDEWFAFKTLVNEIDLEWRRLFP